MSLQLLWMLRVTESVLPESGVFESDFLTHREARTAKRKVRRWCLHHLCVLCDEVPTGCVDTARSGELCLAPQSFPGPAVHRGSLVH